MGGTDECGGHGEVSTKDKIKLLNLSNSQGFIMCVYVHLIFYFCSFKCFKVVAQCQ